MGREQSKSKEKISMVVYFPGKWVFKASVSKFASIKELKGLLPDKSVSFVYDGNLLIDSHTFSFYGIKNGDILIVIKSTDNNFLNQKWIAYSKENDTFNERINSIINPQTTNEVVRLRDLQMSRIERKPKTFRKLCQTATNFETKFNNNRLLEVNISNTPPINPSTSPLPIFWGKNTTSQSQPYLFFSPENVEQERTIDSSVKP